MCWMLHDRLRRCVQWSLSLAISATKTVSGLRDTAKKTPWEAPIHTVRAKEQRNLSQRHTGAHSSPIMEAQPSHQLEPAMLSEEATGRRIAWSQTSYVVSAPAALLSFVDLTPFGPGSMCSNHFGDTCYLRKGFSRNLLHMLAPGISALPSRMPFP